VASKQKGGNGAVLELGTELGDEITNGAVGEREATSDRGHRLALHEKGAHDLVTALLRSLRIEEELAIAMVIHDPALQTVIELFRKTGRKW
jgi:hypothetical protein